MRVTSLIPGWNRDYSMRKNYERQSSVTCARTSLTHKSLGLLRQALPHLLLPAYPGFHHLLRETYSCMSKRNLVVSREVLTKRHYVLGTTQDT